jgi:riboflavin biosynthesis pyrimidine reductase
MLRAGLIDELSLLIAPAADGSVGTAALFDVEGSRRTGRPKRKLQLLSSQKMKTGVVWLRYKFTEKESSPEERGATKDTQNPFFVAS